MKYEKKLESQFYILVKIKFFFFFWDHVKRVF